MSVSAEADVSSPLSEGQSTLDPTISKSSSDSQSLKTEDIAVGQDVKSEPGTPKATPMAFVVDFGNSKPVDNRRLEELAKKSQARHQRVQSMSASLTRPSPAAQRLPMSAKLPRKAQGYNSEGYFSSDQEDSGLSNSLKHRSQKVPSPVNRNIKSPLSDSFQSKRVSKSPIVDGIMSRSDNFTLNPRYGLNLPLKTSSYSKDLYCQPKAMAEIVDQSPVLLTDISSPELDILTPDNGLSTPEMKSPSRKSRASSETPDLFKKCIVNEPLYIDDDVDRQSNSSTGTYTIERDNYTEEQKARMSIDKNVALTDSLKRESSADPELILDLPNCVITKEPRWDTSLRSPTANNQSFEVPKVSKDKNVLEISCCYESPTENDLAAQTSKQIKSTRSYLEKIKNRVRTITEKTFAKSPPKYEDDDSDIGCFTSVTTSGVLNSKYPSHITSITTSGVLSIKHHPKSEIPTPRRCSLTKSEIDHTDFIHRVARESSVPVDYHSRESLVPDYMHRLSRESSVPVSLPSTKSPFSESKFESTAMKNAQKALRDPMTPEQVVGKLSNLSLNRCKGDKTWIQDWADSVKKYNNNVLKDDVEDRPPLSPRNLPGRTRSPISGAPSKIPSPVNTLMHRRTPDLIPQQDTESYLLKTQNAITNLQAKLHSSRTSNLSNIPSQLTSSLISEKTIVSRLPVAQLSRSNSLNYRLRRKDTSSDNSPLRSPGHYVITGSSKLPESTKILLNNASKSLEDRRDSNMNSPSSDRGNSNSHSHSSEDKTLSNRLYDVDAILSPHRKHSRHRSFDKNDPDISNANTVCLKTVLRNNAEAYPRIEPTTRLQGNKKQEKSAFGTSIKRSSSFNTVSRNNNYQRRPGPHVDDRDSDSDYDNCRHKHTHDLKSVAPANSPRCPNTPEPQRKFGPGLVRNSKPKERIVSRMSEPPVSKDERKAGHQSRKISEPTRQAVLNRLTKSRSSTREVPPNKPLDKGPKKLAQHRSSSALATKEAEFSNWKKRSSYDPIKAAQEGRRKQVARRQEYKEELSSPSHSSPVHRSQSFHTTNISSLMMEYSSSETEDEHPALPSDLMTHSAHSEGLALRLRRPHNLYQTSKPDKRNADKRKTYIVDDVTPTKENVDFLREANDKRKTFTLDNNAVDKRKTFIMDSDGNDKRKTFVMDSDANDKRKTFVMDSDTNSTTNGSSARNSSIFSESRLCASESDGESGTESAPVVRRESKGQHSAKQRYSGDFSVSSSTTSASQKKVQPRYLDISKYKSENCSKNFLRRDPSKTYVGVLSASCTDSGKVSRGSAQQYEMEQKKQELEKWKRRASYDPRKAAALGKTKTPPKTASTVLRSQSFHGPVLTSNLRYQPPDHITESYDLSSDNDF